MLTCAEVIDVCRVTGTPEGFKSCGYVYYLLKLTQTPLEIAMNSCFLQSVCKKIFVKRFFKDHSMHALFWDVMMHWLLFFYLF